MGRKRLSEDERAARREADRQKAREAVAALKTSEGWQRWLSLRRHFYRYSLANELSPRGPGLLQSKVADGYAALELRRWRHDRRPTPATMRPRATEERFERVGDAVWALCFPGRRRPRSDQV